MRANHIGNLSREALVHAHRINSVGNLHFLGHNYAPVRTIIAREQTRAGRGVAGGWGGGGGGGGVCGGWGVGGG